MTRKVEVWYSCRNIDAAISYLEDIVERVQDSDPSLNHILDLRDRAIQELEQAREINSGLRSIAECYGEEADDFERLASKLDDRVDELVSDVEHWEKLYEDLQEKYWSLESSLEAV